MIPAHLTSLDEGIRTTQMISPGLHCASNKLIETILEQVPYDFLFITSANISSGRTGQIEPAHAELRGMQDAFGDRDGVVMIGHRNEAEIRNLYPEHLPMSTSIVAFHAATTPSQEARPCLRLERHGSLHFERIQAIANAFDLDLHLGESAQQRLPMRNPCLDHDG